MDYAPNPPLTPTESDSSARGLRQSAPARRRTAMLTGIVALLFALAGAFQALTEDPEWNDAPSRPTASPRDADTPPAAPSPAPPLAPAITWSIVGFDDVSFANVKRYTVRVKLSKVDPTPEDIRTAANGVVAQKRDQADALAFFFYRSDDTVYSANAIASGFWAPYGDWGRAMEKSNQQLVLTFE